MKDKLMLINIGEDNELYLNVDHIVDIEYAYNDQMKKTHIIISMINGKQHIFGSSEFAKYKIEENHLSSIYSDIITELIAPFKGVTIEQSMLIIEEEPVKEEEKVNEETKED